MTVSSSFSGVRTVGDTMVWHAYADLIGQKGPDDPDTLAGLFAAPRYGSPPEEVLYVLDFINPEYSAAIGTLISRQGAHDPDKEVQLYDNRPWVVETPWIVQALVDEYDFDHPNVEIIAEIEKLIAEIRDRETVVQTTATGDMSKSARNRELLAANADRLDPMKITADQCGGHISAVRDGGTIILTRELAEACLRGVLIDIILDVFRLGAGVLPTFMRIDIIPNPDPPPTIKQLAGHVFIDQGLHYRANRKVNKGGHTLTYGPAWPDPPHDATGYVERSDINDRTEAGKKMLRRLEIIDD